MSALIARVQERIREELPRPFFRSNAKQKAVFVAALAVGSFYSPAALLGAMVGFKIGVVFNRVETLARSLDAPFTNWQDIVNLPKPPAWQQRLLLLLNSNFTVPTLTKVACSALFQGVLQTGLSAALIGASLMAPATAATVAIAVTVSFHVLFYVFAVKPYQFAAMKRPANWQRTVFEIGCLAIPALCSGVMMSRAGWPGLLASAVAYQIGNDLLYRE